MNDNVMEFLVVLMLGLIGLAIVLTILFNMVQPT